MRLEGNFYKIESLEQKDENSYAITVTILPGHPIYEGHFPAQAVVPGVCTLTIIRECIGKIMQREIFFSAIKECKYVSALLPEDNLGIIINISITDSTKIKAQVERADNQQAVLKLRADIR